MTGVTAFVLAGGRSVRMGREKALAPWQGGTLLGRALQTAGAVAGAVRIVGAREKFESYGTVVEDLYQGLGPLAGIHAALRSTTTTLNLVLAVDLPYVTPALLGYLKECAEDGRATITVPHLTAGWEPLCGFYRREFAGIAELALREGRNAIHPLLESLHGGDIRAVSEKELEGAGFAPVMFRNINTVGDLEKASGENRERSKLEIQ